MAIVLDRLQRSLNRPKGKKMLFLIVTFQCILGVLSHDQQSTAASSSPSSSYSQTSLLSSSSSSSSSSSLLSSLQNSSRQIRSPTVERNLGGHDGKTYFQGIYPTKSLSPNEDRMRCVYYNNSECAQTNGQVGCGKDNQVCQNDSDSDHTGDHTHLCYALWTFVDGEPKITLKGCWVGELKSCSTMDNNKSGMCAMPPVDKKKKGAKGLIFCCCDGPNCNENLQLDASMVAGQTTTGIDLNHSTDPQGSKDPTPTSSSVPTTFSWLLIVILIVLVFILVGAVLGAKSVLVALRSKKRSTEGDAPTSEPLLDDENGLGQKQGHGYMGPGPITLNEVVAQGKFGYVFKGTDATDNIVAVKVFNAIDEASWKTEKEIYLLPQMKHPNILTFLGSERKINGNTVTFWLISEYHPLGSLSDYLKSHTINLKEFLTIFIGIARGLTHLHEGWPATDTEPAKPSIAHRDFKSKNVLLSTNLRPCICDFGLAMTFNQNKLCSDAHGQVGTRRYMAPEVLEGSITFTWDSFARIDMYAFGLVAWELLTRTNVDDIVADDYQMPFEREIGTNPTAEDMQEFVCQKKNRPVIKEEWDKHPILMGVAQTIRDIWDQEPEARLSASNVIERLENSISMLGTGDIDNDDARPVQIQLQDQQNQFRVVYMPNVANGQIIAPNKDVLSNVHCSPSRGQHHPMYHQQQQLQQQQQQQFFDRI